MSAPIKCSTCRHDLSPSSYDTKKTGKYLKTCRTCLSSKVHTYNKIRAAPIRDLKSVRQDLLCIILTINDAAHLGQLLSFALSTIPLKSQNPQNTQLLDVASLPQELLANGTSHTTCEAGNGLDATSANPPRTSGLPI